VVFWGGSDGVAPLKGTWEYDGTTWVSPAATPSPPALAGAATAYDPLYQRIVMLGGATSGGGRLADMWSWDGSTWNKEAGPYGFAYGALVWDAGRQRLVVYGGQSPLITGTDETYEY
jgi:hypothetical protein